MKRRWNVDVVIKLANGDHYRYAYTIDIQRRKGWNAAAASAIEGARKELTAAKVAGRSKIVGYQLDIDEISVE